MEASVPLRNLPPGEYSVDGGLPAAERDLERPPSPPAASLATRDAPASRLRPERPLDACLGSGGTSLPLWVGRGPKGLLRLPPLSRPSCSPPGLYRRKGLALLLLLPAPPLTSVVASSVSPDGGPSTEPPPRVLPLPNDQLCLADPALGRVVGPSPSPLNRHPAVPAADPPSPNPIPLE